MNRSVMVHELLASLPINAAMDEVPCFERSVDQVKNMVANLARVENRALCCCGLEGTIIAFLTTAFGIETGFVQDDCMGCTVGCVRSNQW